MHILPFIKQATRSLAVVSLILGTGLTTSANQILLDVAGGHGTTSTSDPIPPEGFTFSIGSFGSFEPTAENTSEWSNYFIEEDPSTGVEVGLVLGHSPWWNYADQGYAEYGGTGFQSVIRPNGGIQGGEQIYIWGWNTRDLEDIAEWILITNPAWEFPPPTPWAQVFIPNSFPSTLDSGTHAIVGSIDHSSTDIFERYLQTASVGAMQGSLSGGRFQPGRWRKSTGIGNFFHGIGWRIRDT